MKIDLQRKNDALISLFKDPTQIVTLDANLIIPPDRSRYSTKAIPFSFFKRIWLEPIFTIFPNIAIHEAVSNELVTQPVKLFIDKKAGLNILKDSSLTDTEKILRDAIEIKIFPYTNYEPILDNKDDRGEVKSLAYIAVKGLIYFASNDYNATQLVEKSKEWLTGLDNVQTIKMYELIYYLNTTEQFEKLGLKTLYKYQYYLTKKEKEQNPNWGDFILNMNKLYFTSY